MSLTELRDCLGPLGWSRRRGQESLQWSSHQGKRAEVQRIFITRPSEFLFKVQSTIFLMGFFWFQELKTTTPSLQVG